MINTLFTTKGKMSQVFTDSVSLPVTWLTVPQLVVNRLKTVETDGYNGVQLAVGTRRGKPAYLKEVRLELPDADLKVGDVLAIDQIATVGDTVKITGTSKGKGFAGVMKRHNFHGGPRTHGQSDRARAPGSIGRGTTPGRVLKGKKMAGRMGGDTVTVSNLKIINLDLENRKIAVSGPIPGATTGLITLTITKKHA